MKFLSFPAVSARARGPRLVAYFQRYVFEGVLRGAARARASRRLGLSDRIVSSISWSYDGELNLSEMPEFFFSTRQGVFRFEEGRINQILPFRAYGLTYLEEEKALFAAASLVETGRGRYDNIVRIDMETLTPSVFSGPLRKHVHQIDYFGGRFYVTECYHNSIAVVSRSGRLLRRLYPCGRGLHKPRLGNYKHFNSVFSDGQQIFLFAHNKGVSVHEKRVITGESSEIVSLNMKGRFQRSEKVHAMNGHNVYVNDKGERLFCDSGGRHALCRDKEVLFSAQGMYLRGLAVNDRITLVGGSVIGGQEAREEGDGSIYVLDGKSFQQVGVFQLKSVGQIYDIRLRVGDRAMSATASEEN